MKQGRPPRPSALLLALAFAVCLPGVGHAADEKCVSQCDEEADKCMIASGKDTSKQRQCDLAVDECLRKCG